MNTGHSESNPPRNLPTVNKISKVSFPLIRKKCINNGNASVIAPSAPIVLANTSNTSRINASEAEISAASTSLANVSATSAPLANHPVVSTALEKSSCLACKAGHFASQHICIFCLKAVHILEGCSIPAPGSEEGSSQRRICLKCLSSTNNAPANDFTAQKPSGGTFKRRTAFSIKGMVATQNPKNGLKNFGNACYFNSVVQCLNSTTELSNWFWKQTLELYGEGPFVVKELVFLFKKLWAGDSQTSAANFKKVVGNHNETFKNKK